MYHKAHGPGLSSLKSECFQSSDARHSGGTEFHFEFGNVIMTNIDIQELYCRGVRVKLAVPTVQDEPGHTGAAMRAERFTRKARLASIFAEDKETA